MAVSLASKPNPLRVLWQHYEHCLHRAPLLTNIATSSVLWGAGDLLAQRCMGAKDSNLDVRRTALTAAFGGALIGPVGHWWYDHMLDWLVAFFGKCGTVRALVAKVVLDNTLYSSFYMLAFFAFGELVLDKGSWSNLMVQLKEEFLPTYLAEVLAWPPIMAVIFSKMPKNTHLLMVNLLCVVDVAFLAIIRSGAASLNDIGKPAGSPDTASSKAASKAAAKAEKQKKQAKPAPKAEPKEPAAHQPDMWLLPALASVHSGNTAGSSRRKKGGEEAAAPGDGWVGQVQQVIQSWVPAIHRA